MANHTNSVYGWEQEPADERPSEFRQSTGYSVLSGYHIPSDLNTRVARRQQASGWGFRTLVIAFVVLLGVSGVVISEVVKVFRG
jgi:hypothetical protein